MEYIIDEYRVHLIVYHLVWTPKRCKKILKENLAIECDSLIRQKCEEKGWKIIELSIQEDNIHLFVRAFPTTPACEIVKECKGITAFTLRKKYPELLKLPSLWTKSYFASTAGNISSETIQKYIQAQNKK